MRLLIVEDEKSLADVIIRRLSQEGYIVDRAGDGKTAQLFIDGTEYDCIILDIMLPEIDGLSLLKRLRVNKNQTPVLLLTAKDTVDDRVNGLDSGADDYQVKPFALDELSARVRALVRRGTGGRNPLLETGDLQMDIISRRVTRGGTVIELSSKEYAILEYMLRNPERVLTRDQIIEHVWGYDYDCDSNIIDVYMRYLRRKIDAGFDEKLIHTVWGTGYVLRNGGK